MPIFGQFPQASRSFRLVPVDPLAQAMNRKIKMRSGNAATTTEIDQPERFDHHRECLACMGLRSQGIGRYGHVMAGWFLH